MSRQNCLFCAFKLFPMSINVMWCNMTKSEHDCELITIVILNLVSSFILWKCCEYKLLNILYQYWFSESVMWVIMFIRISRPPSQLLVISDKWRLVDWWQHWHCCYGEVFERRCLSDGVYIGTRRNDKFALWNFSLLKFAKWRQQKCALTTSCLLFIPSSPNEEPPDLVSYKSMWFYKYQLVLFK